MERQASRDRRNLGLSTYPSHASTAVGYAAKTMVNQHKAYYNTARTIMMNSKYNAKEDVLAFDAYANSRFDSIHGLMGQLAKS